MKYSFISSSSCSAVRLGPSRPPRPRPLPPPRPLRPVQSCLPSDVHPVLLSTNSACTRWQRQPAAVRPKGSQDPGGLHVRRGCFSCQICRLRRRCELRPAPHLAARPPPRPPPRPAGAASPRRGPRPPVFATPPPRVVVAEPPRPLPRPSRAILDDWNRSGRSRATACIRYLKYSREVCCCRVFV